MKTTILLTFCLLDSMIKWPIAIEESQKVAYPGTTRQKADPEKFGWEVKKPDTVFAYANV